MIIVHVIIRFVIVVVVLAAFGHLTPSVDADDHLRFISMIVYGREDCSHCLHFKQIIARAQEDFPNLVIIYKDVAIERYREEAEQFGIEGVPAFSFDGKHFHEGEVLLLALENMIRAS